MNNKSMKKFLRYLRNNKIIELYENFFDKMFDFEKLLYFDEKDVKELVLSDKIVATIKMYEMVNNMTINNTIKNYILSLKDIDAIKYSLRLAVSSSFDNEEEKLKYVKVVSESEKSLRYAWIVANKKEVNSHKDGLECVKIVGNTDEEIGVFLRDLLFDDQFVKRENILNYLEILSTSKEDYIAEYCCDFLKSSSDLDDKKLIECLYILHCAKGKVQAECAYYILKNKKIMERNDGVLIALSIATREEGYQSEKGLLLTLDDELMKKEDASNIIFDAMGEDLLDKEYDSECDLEELFKKRDLNEIINGLTTISDNENVNAKTRVKIMR